MSKVSALIVEDELIIAEDLKGILRELDYDIIGIACDIPKAEAILAKTVPDIALVDIQLRDREDGIRLGKKIKELYHIPVIFITSHADKATIDKAKLISPDGYIVKPFRKEDLFTAIELALFNYSSRQNLQVKIPAELSDSIVRNDSIFIRKDYMLIKIRFDDLKWIKSDDNYLELYCLGSKHLIRTTLKDFVEKLPAETFIQVHKSYCINLKYITAINKMFVWIDKQAIPIGRLYIDNLKRILKIEL